jgi:hypothetical protein
VYESGFVLRHDILSGGVGIYPKRLSVMVECYRVQ